MSPRLLILFAALACMLSVAPAQAKKDKASSREVAIRWDASQGGPQTAEEAWTTLGLAAPDRSEFDVRYFKVLKGPAPPPGFDVIGRERRRLDPPNYEVTYKVRGSANGPLSPQLSEWACPLGQTKDRKDETDLIFVGNEAPRQAMSRSCTIESETAFPPMPADLTVLRNECSNKMIRLKLSGKVDTKVEEWKLRSGQTIIEVSMSGPLSDSDIDNFKTKVVDNLVPPKNKVHPLSDSKTQLGSTCQ